MAWAGRVRVTVHFDEAGIREGDAVVQMSSGSKEESTLEHMMRGS
jgi:hypothetical protein